MTTFGDLAEEVERDPSFPDTAVLEELEDHVGRWKTPALNRAVINALRHAYAAWRGLRTGEQYGGVYFIETGWHGPIKIGWSLDPRRRLHEFQGVNGYRLRLLGVFPGTHGDERRMQHRFERFLVQKDGMCPPCGREWFHWDESIHQALHDHPLLCMYELRDAEGEVEDGRWRWWRVAPDDARKR